MHDSNKEKYLGDIDCDDGKVDDNVDARCAKGYGIAGDILAILDEQGKKSKKAKEGKLYFVYRPNTGQQVKQESLAELKKKYKKVNSEECEEHWNKQFDSSARTCSHAFWKGNCRNKSVGIECEVGLRKKSYNVLTGQSLPHGLPLTSLVLCQDLC